MSITRKKIVDVKTEDEQPSATIGKTVSMKIKGLSVIDVVDIAKKAHMDLVNLSIRNMTSDVVVVDTDMVILPGEVTSIKPEHQYAALSIAGNGEIELILEGI